MANTAKISFVSAILPVDECRTENVKGGIDGDME